MIFYFIHRLAPYPLSTREASSSSKQKCIHTPIGRHHVERGSRLQVSLSFFPRLLREVHGRGGGILLELEQMEDMYRI